MRKGVLVLTILVLATVVGAQEAKYERWHLDIEYGTPSFIPVKDALGDIRLAWYLTYKLTNNNDRDVPLEIRITAHTDTNKSYRDSIDPRAERILEKKLGKDFKNAVDLTNGTIAAGTSMECIAFFGELDPNWDTLDVKVAGLWDTIDKVDGKLYYEKKVLVLTWSRPGDEFSFASDPITFKGKKRVIEGQRREVPQTPVN